MCQTNQKKSKATKQTKSNLSISLCNQEIALKLFLEGMTGGGKKYLLFPSSPIDND
jgi:hypothetical protein